MELKYWLFCCLLPLLFSNGYGRDCQEVNQDYADTKSCKRWWHCDDGFNPDYSNCNNPEPDYVIIGDIEMSCGETDKEACKEYSSPGAQPQLHSASTTIPYHFVKNETFERARMNCSFRNFASTSIESIDENEWIKKQVEFFKSGCPWDTIPDPDTNECYGVSSNVSEKEVSWKEAKKRCEDSDSTLLKIDNEKEFDWIRAHMKEWDTENGWDGHDHFWIGLYQDREGLPWKWIDGEPMDDNTTPWNYGEPNNYPAPPGESCVEMASHYEGLNDYDCNDTFRYICEVKAYNGSYWDFGDQYWTSGRKNTTSGEWYWKEPSTHAIDYTDWCNPVNPDCHYGDDGYDCLVLDYNLNLTTYGGGWWNAAKCSDVYTYICEAPNVTDPDPRPPGDEFLKWHYCDCLKEDDGKRHGFCETYYTCYEDDDGNCRKNTTNCTAGELFFNDRVTDANQGCMDIAEFRENHRYCDSWRYNDPSCTAEGIFRNQRNCGKFYACIDNPDDGNFILMHYDCPDGWIYFDSYRSCLPKTMDQHKSACPFDYDDDPFPVQVDYSTQCKSGYGQFIAYEDPDHPEYEDDFIMCIAPPFRHSQAGPFYCPPRTKFDNDKHHCVLH